MKIDNFINNVIITADRGKYLSLKDNKNSTDLLGKPERIILSKQGKIPEFEEKEI